ncbi:MAG: hypothetical protein K2K35_08395 [Lachnospiraceae bacterium]|nr:hypothetical protein [Lachnospiraceae bacterium]
MSEEKDLDQIENDSPGSDDGFGGLEDFVELDDLQNLEGLGDLSGLGDISDLGDLSDLQGVASEPAGLDDLDVNIDIPLPVMEEAGQEEQAREAEADTGAVTEPPIQEEEEITDIPAAEIPAEETLMPEPGETEALEEPGIEEEIPDIIPGLEDGISMLDSEDSEGITEELEEQDGLDMDIPGIEEEPLPEETGILEEEPLLDDIAFDTVEEMMPLEEEEEIVPGPGSVPEEEIQEEEPGGTYDDGGEADSMLDGLDSMLDSLDINGSLDEEEVLPGGTEEESGDGLDSMLDSLGMPDAVVAGVSGEGTAEEQQEEAEEEEKKPGFFKRVFGNVVTDEIAEAERKAKEEEEEQAVLKAEEEAKAKEEKEAKKAAAAEAKAAKKAAKAAKKAEKEEQKAAKKAEKQAKKEAEKEEEEQEVVGKLNKAGVIIVVAGSALLLAGVILGTNIFGYSASKSEAERYFTLQKYSDAYNEARGTKMKEKDPELYDKIITVMKVQQSLDSYNSYAVMKYYPDALDSLLRGLQKYDENIDMALDLEIEGDMKVCKNRILSILKDEFSLSEQEAYDILSLDAEEYTRKVVGIAKKKI